jgi:hypothetical protein
LARFFEFHLSREMDFWVLALYWLTNLGTDKPLQQIHSKQSPHSQDGFVSQVLSLLAGCTLYIMALQTRQAHAPRAGLGQPSALAAAHRLHSTSHIRKFSRIMKPAVATTTATTSVEVAAAVEPNLAAVWDLPYSPTRIHVMLGTPLSISEIVPLQLEDLRPANLTKPAILEFLQSSLTTRAAVQKGVQCMVLSASSYLPSQLDTIKSLAYGIGLATAICISQGSVHLLLMPSLAGLTDAEFQQRVSSITHSSRELLAPTFGKLQVLPTERLTAARAAEQILNRHLRLWHPPSWGETLQQVLMSRHAYGHRRAIAGERCCKTS